MFDLANLVRQCGVELYDAETVSENGRTIYRVSITKPAGESGRSGVSLDECEAVSRLLSPIFDVEPPVSGEWHLEVSSPGMERKLTKPAHFSLSVGERVKVTTVSKEVLIGELVAFDGAVLGVLVGGERVSVSLNDVKKARTFVEW